MVDKVCNGICRLLASNPKDYTGTGTNTYVAGNNTVWIIDPGPAEEDHIDAVIKAVNGRLVEGVLVTHTHLDHSPAANILKYKLGVKTFGFGALSPDTLALTTEEVDTDFAPDVKLHHGKIIGSGDWRLQAIHTPGHFPNHMCYMLPEQGVLFSGDHVTGWSTTMIVPPLGNLSDYMESLNVLELCNADIMLPSHGESVLKPNSRIDEVRQHRKVRHAQVRKCMQAGVTDPAEIVDCIYDGLSKVLVDAAMGSVKAHMEVLYQEFEKNESFIFSSLDIGLKNTY